MTWVAKLDLAWCRLAQYRIRPVVTLVSVGLMGAGGEGVALGGDGGGGGGTL